MLLAFFALRGLFILVGRNNTCSHENLYLFDAAPSPMRALASYSRISSSSPGIPPLPNSSTAPASASFASLNEKPTERGSLTSHTMSSAMGWIKTWLAGLFTIFQKELKLKNAPRTRRQNGTKWYRSR